MLKRPQFFVFLKNFALITVLLLGIVWLERKINISVTPPNNHVNARLEIESDSSDNVLQWNAKHSFPGVFNLMEDAAHFTGTLQRPIKECSFG